MNDAFQSLRPFIRGVVRHAYLVLVLAFAFTAAGLYFASDLRIDTDFSNLVPEHYESVQALERLQETVGGESEVAVGITSPSFEANRTFAETLIPRALALQRNDTEPFLSRVEFRRDTEFMENNALYFATDDELDDIMWYLEDLIEEAALEANPFYFGMDDDDEFEDGEDRIAALDAVYDDLVGTEYAVSDDSTTLVVRFYPTGAQTDIGFIDDLYSELENLVAELEPQGFHADMEVTLAGRLYRQLVEVQTITNDVMSSFGLGVLAVLLFVTLYFVYKSYRARAGYQYSTRALSTSVFRAPVLALVIGLPLLMSLTWTFGLASLIFGSLNLMTSTLGLVLFGLGIDYGIHFYGRYTEERAEGASITEAAETTFVGTGQAITIGALTTAAALYVLYFADFRGFSEFGVIAGNGVLLALLAMTVVMPALLAVLERWRLLNFTAGDADYQVTTNGGRRYPAARTVLIGSIVAVVVAVVLLPRVDFEYDFGVLEPEYTAYEEKRDVIREAERAAGPRNPAYVVVDSPEEVEAVTRAVEERKRELGDDSLVEEVQSLQQRFPMREAQQQERLERIAELRDLLDSRYLRDSDDEDLERLRQASQTTAPIDVAQVPDYIRQQFEARDGTIGNFVMIVPNVSLADGRMSMAFAEEVGTIVTEDGTTYHAGSTSIVAADMLRLLQQEAPWMILATFLVVALLMWLNFGSIRWAAVAMLPLGVGVLWMMLVMELFGLKFNFYNMIVLPAVVGIGNDAGAHLAHRYREEGPGSLWRVLRSTGEHVTIGALTTMIGFGGLLLSFHPGISSIGVLAVIGIGTTLFSALLFLPAFVQWLEDRDQTPHAEDLSADEDTQEFTGDGASGEPQAEASVPKPSS